MTGSRRLTVLALALAFGIDHAVAHHAQLGFDRKQIFRITGIVAELLWTSPHSEVLLDVTDPEGRITRWSLESEPGGVLERRGLNRTALEVGSEVTIEMHPRKNGEPRGILLSVTTSDGELVRVGGRSYRRRSGNR